MKTDEQLDRKALDTSAKHASRELYRSHEVFRKLAHRTAHGVGHPIAFVTALSMMILWAALGPLFGFSDTWQLVVNTATTIVTFLMVFLIQNTQNRDSHAIHLKLDELIRAQRGARKGLIALEDLTDAELDELESEFHRLAEKTIARRSSRSREPHVTHPRKKEAARG
jgi:low affinity Fe/Cu permease